jgi:hypothetical protein
MERRRGRILYPAHCDDTANGLYANPTITLTEGVATRMRLYRWTRQTAREMERMMTERQQSDQYFGSDESRFATTQDEQRLSGESAPPALTDESGTPHFAKGRASAEHQASEHELTEHEQGRRADAHDQERPPSRGVKDTSAKE